MTCLWTAQQADLVTGGRCTGDWRATGVSIDTRSLVAGDLFVALKDQRDGHDFVAQAFEKGASAALVDHVPEGVDETVHPLLIVDDVMAALEALAVAGRARSTARVIAVTGSVGKTSTKEMLRTILEGQGKVHAADKSFNNHWGVPLTLARLPGDADFAVIEIGMNHPGEIAPLARLTRPHVAMITTIAAAHLEAFDDIAAIAAEKASVFEGLEPGGAAVIHADLEVSDAMIAAAEAVDAEVITFGAAEDSDLFLKNARTADGVTVVQAERRDQPFLYKLYNPGRHFVQNALGALAVIDGLDADFDVAAMDISRWRPPAGRGAIETVVLDVVDDHLQLLLIDDAYNANPTSLAAALEVLAATEPQDDVGRVGKGRRIAILGDMLELGETEVQMHREIANLPSLASVDLVHCAGPLMRALYDALPEQKRGQWFENAQELAAKVHSLVDAGDTILVKGSKGSKVSLVVDAIRKLGHPQAQQQQGAD